MGPFTGFGVYAAALLSLALLYAQEVSAQGRSAQGLISVPPTVTQELAAYYISSFGPDISFYSTLTQRNIPGTNAYRQVNGIGEREDPIAAAFRTSPVRGIYTETGIGGKVTVEIFYKLLRCVGGTGCGSFNRVVVSGSSNPAAPKDALTYVKGTIGETGWLIDASQPTVNDVLATAQEKMYQDAAYKTQLYYKVVPPPRPCSSASPQSAWGAIGQFANIPQFACIRFGGVPMMMATDNLRGAVAMQTYAVGAGECDGSLNLVYETTSSSVGPQITLLVRNPGAVPVTVSMTLPPAVASGCLSLYSSVNATLQAAAFLGSQIDFSTTKVSSRYLPVPTFIDSLGFTDSCAPIQFFALYGAVAFGQTNDIQDQAANNRTFLDGLIPYNPRGACISMVGVNEYDSRNSDEDACSQLYYGDDSQRREGIITSYGLDSQTSGAIADSRAANFSAYCGTNTALGVRNILPQIAIDFEAYKNFLRSSTEVKMHLDVAAANAASVLAVEVALASSGIVIARTIARSSFYRRRHLSSSTARLLACGVAAVGITLFNIPNFFLISRSLANHKEKSIYTQTSVHQYKPSNYSAVLVSETHSFVTVQGSSVTAVLGLALYFLTLAFSLYVTWGEFSEIIRRR
jgi:hypothetical protein